MIGHPLKVRELLDEIARGEIVLPEFQRSYVWRPHQVVCLIDSLYRDYPIGQILLWDTTEAPISKGLEGVDPADLATVGRPKIVLDGQQRLTSLHKALDPSAAEPVEVLFNLETEQFVPHAERLAVHPTWISVREVLSQDRHDLEILQAIAAAGGPGLDDPACRDYLDRLRRLRRILEYPFPVEIFRSDAFDDVIELFIRINSAGTRLHHAELVLAQLTLKLPGTIVEEVEDALEALEEREFSLDARFLVRAFVAIGTGQSRFRNLGELWERPDEELAEVWRRTDRALSRTVEFVRRNARLPSSDWVPSINGLIPLVAYFDRYPQPARKDEVALLRWLYLTMLRRRYSASQEARLDEDLRAIASDRPVAALLDGILSSAGSLSVSPEELEGATSRGPLLPLALAATVKRGAADWFTGLALAPGQRAVVAPIFPTSLLKQAGVPRSLRDEVANLVFLGAEPDEASAQTPKELLAQVARAGRERLEAQSVPLDRGLWEVDRYEEFLAARRELLAEAINELLDDPV